MSLRTFVMDTWSYLGYKSTFSDAPNAAPAGSPWSPPGWVPEAEKRRLEAYKLYDAYYRNNASQYLSWDLSPSDKKKRREYGDPHLLVETALSSMLGDKFSILVKGAPTGDTAARAQQEVFDQWAEDERLQLKIVECERNSIKLGDGVYVIGFDEKKGRPRVSLWDPGFFFPDMERQHLSIEEFPTLVNICYEFTMKNAAREDKQYVRRIQWRLSDVDDQGTNWSFPVAWRDKPATRNVLMSDGYWLLDNMGEDPMTFDEGKAIWLIEPVWLGVDVIPVVHIPCFTAEQEFWSVPITAAVMQIFDDLVSTDTDLQASCAIAGTPAVAIKGSHLPSDEDGNVMTYGPGQVIEVGDGDATVIDTSNGLKAQIDYKNELLERLSVNGRTPEALLGRVKPNEVPSGIALALGFSQHTNMIREMRTVRKDKYALFFKIVWRFMAQAGMVSGDYIETNLHFGSYLPSDMEQTVEQIVQLTAAKKISVETAVTMMLQAGFPIEDAAEEVARIFQQDVDTIQKIVEITLDVNYGRELLGLTPMQGPEVMPSGNVFEDQQAMNQQAMDAMNQEMQSQAVA